VGRSCLIQDEKVMMDNSVQMQRNNTKHLYLVFLFLFVPMLHVDAQETIYGSDRFIEYQAGSLPFVISVPHGGDISPDTIPERTCNDPVYATDAYTRELAEAINQSLYERTGCYPHIIYCHLDRPKLDCNRPLAEGACGNPSAVKAWKEFHAFIDTAQSRAGNDYQGNIFYIDLHGHSNPYQRIELGYLLYDYELEYSDAILNEQKYVNYSSIQNLVAHNRHDYTHAELLRGEHALGTLLGNKGYQAVPSQQMPRPGTNTNYYSGGYNTAHHTSYAYGNEVNGVQMECPYQGLRNNAANRQAFADSLSLILLNYLKTHRKVDLGECATATSSAPDQQHSRQINVFPNPCPGDRNFLHIEGTNERKTGYKLFNSLGQMVASGSLKGERLKLPAGLQQGMYLLWLESRQNQTQYVVKLMVQ